MLGKCERLTAQDASSPEKTVSDNRVLFHKVYNARRSSSVRLKHIIAAIRYRNFTALLHKTAWFVWHAYTGTH